MVTPTAEEVNNMSVKDLKSLIKSAGLSFAGCVEKSDLKQKAIEAITRLEMKPENAPSSGGDQLKRASKNYAGYNCAVSGKAIDKSCDGVVIMLHGFQAQNSDLVPVAQEFYSSRYFDKNKNIVFVFPQAPSGGMLNAPQWWDLDIMKWMGAASGDPQIQARLLKEKPSGLDIARKNLNKMIEEVCQEFNLESHKHVILAGFSMGAMTVMDLTIDKLKSSSSGPELTAATCMISGAPIVIDEWAMKLKQYTESEKEKLKVAKDNNNEINDTNEIKKLKVLVTHGTQDPVLPFSVSSWTKDILEKAADAVDLKYITHNEGHTIGCQNTKDQIFHFWAEIFKLADEEKN